jgi:hypothetical protein
MAPDWMQISVYEGDGRLRSSSSHTSVNAEHGDNFNIGNGLGGTLYVRLDDEVGFVPKYVSGNEKNNQDGE